MPFRGFIAAYATKGQPFLSQSRAGSCPLCVVVKSKGPTAGQTPLALLALLQFELPLPLQFAKLAAETTNKGCPKGVYFFGLAAACTAALKRFASDFRRFLM